MSVSKYQLKHARRFDLIGHVMLGVVIIAAIIGFNGGWSSNLYQMMIITGFMTLTFYGMGLRAKQIAKVSTERSVEIASDRSMFDERRVIFQRSMSWTLKCHYFSLEGEELAHSIEYRSKKEKWWKPPLELVGLRMYLPVEYQYTVGHDQTYTLKKAGGWSKPLYLYDQHGQLLGHYKQKWKEVTKLNFDLYNEKGEHVATMNGGMSGLEFTIDSVDELRWGFMRIGGVPVEAMEIFQDGGDIFDMNTELNRSSRILTMAAPIAIHTYYKIKM